MSQQQQQKLLAPSVPDHWRATITSIRSLRRTLGDNEPLFQQIHRVHNRLKRSPEFWGTKVARKCRRLYADALENAGDEARILAELKEHVDALIASHPESSPTLGGPKRSGDDSEALAKRKKRRVDADALQDSTSSFDPSSIAVVTTTASGMLVIPTGRFVAARIRKEEGADWILASVVAFVEERNRYEVEDAEPDSENSDFKKKYRLPSTSILPLPTVPAAAPRLPAGVRVLALYPDTSCFYRATVVTPYSEKSGYRCSVRFDEDDDEIRLILAHRIVPMPS